jgi:hypothetical protein
LIFGEGNGKEAKRKPDSGNQPNKWTAAAVAEVFLAKALAFQPKNFRVPLFRTVQGADWQ